MPAGKDGSEFALVLARMGLAHPTGYPLYTLVGHAFVLAIHALGATWAVAANAFSAAGAGVALGLLHAACSSLVRSRAGSRHAAWIALLPVVALALDPAWTAVATLAEVHAWHMACVALAALVALGIEPMLASPARLARASLLWGGAAGLALAHHATSVFFVAPLTLGLLVAAGRAHARLRFAGFAAVGAVPPLLSLGYVAWRAAHPADVQWPALEPGFSGVLAHVTAAQYRAFLGGFAPSAAQSRVLVPYVYPLLALGGAGAVAALARRNSRAEPVRVALAGAVLLQTAAAFLYGVPDPAPYFLPPLAIGLVLLTSEAAGWGRVRRFAPVLLALLVPATLAFAIHGALVTRQRTTDYERFDALLRDMWLHVPPGPSFVVWDDDMAHRLRAFQLLEGLRPELIVVQPRLLSYPAARRTFAARYGVDPVAGLDARPTRQARGTDAAAPLVGALVENLNQRSKLPVFVFLPQLPSIRMLRKPAADSTGSKSP